MAEHCRIHAEESGESRRATAYDEEFEPVCRECAKDLAVGRSNDRYWARLESYAAHEES